MLSALILMSTIAASPLNGAPVALPFTAEEATASVGDMVAAEAHSKAVTPRVKPVAAEEVSFIDMYYPFMLADDLNPEVEDNLTVVWIVSALLWWAVGPLWIPKALVGLDVDDDYLMEALIGWLLHGAPFLLSWVPVVGQILFIAYFLANGLYLSPVHIINTYNRHIVGGGKKKSGDGESKKSADLKGVLGMPEVAAAAF